MFCTCVSHGKVLVAWVGLGYNEAYHAGSEVRSGIYYELPLCWQAPEKVSGKRGDFGPNVGGREIHEQSSISFQ